MPYTATEAIKDKQRHRNPSAPFPAPCGSLHMYSTQFNGPVRVSLKGLQCVAPIFDHTDL